MSSHPSYSRPAPRRPAAFEQTRLEYETLRSGIGSSAHRELVKLALTAGKQVPVHVLAEYPELLSETIKPHSHCIEGRD